MGRHVIAAGTIRTHSGKTTTIIRTDNGTRTGAVSGRITPTPTRKDTSR